MVYSVYSSSYIFVYIIFIVLLLILEIYHSLASLQSFKAVICNYGILIKGRFNQLDHHRIRVFELQRCTTKIKHSMPDLLASGPSFVTASARLCFSLPLEITNSVLIRFLINHPFKLPEFAYLLEENKLARPFN